MVLRRNRASAPPQESPEKADSADKPTKKRTAPPMTPARLARLTTRLDRAMIAIVLVLGFFLASFAVRNSDFWMHLATGRLIAQGNYVFGVDPFSYTTQ